MRNDAGHPPGTSVARDEVFTQIVHLGPTYRHIRPIIAKLQYRYFLIPHAS
ncbi:MAG: hypothetical protein Q8P41_18545 [Pseudomonadota bacterium]|nr:hypothetical protein [Pseudomonadota bacterium]